MMQTSDNYFRDFLLSKGLTIKDETLISVVDKDIKEGKPLRYLIYGKVGTGKTEMAKQICLAVNKRYYRTDALSVSKIIPDLDFIINDHDIIVVDDIGTEPTEERRYIDKFIYSMQKAFDNGSDIGLIITTNLNSTGLYNTYGSRVFDRLIGSLTVLPELKSPSFRQANKKIIKEVS